MLISYVSRHTFHTYFRTSLESGDYCHSTEKEKKRRGRGYEVVTGDAVEIPLGQGRLSSGYGNRRGSLRSVDHGTSLGTVPVTRGVRVTVVKTQAYLRLRKGHSGYVRSDGTLKKGL